MMDRIKALGIRIKEWWNGFEPKQKTIIISIAAGVIVMFTLLIFLLGRPQYEILIVCEDTNEAAQVTELLGEEYTYTTTQDGLTISVLESQAAEARILLGANNITAAAYGIDNVFSGGFGETESDKEKKYLLYKESKYEEDIEAFDFVKSARVNLYQADNDGTLLSAATESNASIILETEGTVPDEAAVAIAKAIANALGNSNTDKVTIIDTEGNLLFSNDADYSAAGSASTQLKVKSQLETIVRNNVQRVLLGTYSDVQVAPNLVIDFSSTELASEDYSAPDGQDQGMLDSADIYTEDSTSGTSGVPGTDSNTDQTYVFEDSSESNSSISDEHYDYLPNKTVTKQEIPAGAILEDQSSVAVSAISYKIVKEEDVKTQGLLSGLTWEEYKLANSESVKLTVDEELYGLVSDATGIDLDDITIIAYEEPIFYDEDGLNIGFADVVQILVFVLIIGLLAFVVLRSMAKNKGDGTEEEELSVETLLQSTPEDNVEDIGVESKSETRKMIEKFVEDNPEAAANLLRNWLNEDWG
jgi:flagellar M-ring protein FliF